MKVIDLTHTITADMPVYPGTEKPKLLSANTLEKDGFKETLITMFSHTGTHIDPPAHLLEKGTTLDSFAPESFMGKALVIDCKALKAGDAITMEQVAPYGERLGTVDFLLFNTGWDKYWGTEEYFGDYPCIDREVLEFILKGKYKGIGFDVIGLDPIADADLPRHKRIFESATMINVENLKNLHLCGDEPFTFVCLPLKVEGSDGAPARAVAWLD